MFTRAELRAVPKDDAYTSAKVQERIGKLAGTAVTIDQGRLYIDNVGGILAALLAAIPPAGGWPSREQSEKISC